MTHSSRPSVFVHIERVLTRGFMGPHRHMTRRCVHAWRKVPPAVCHSINACLSVFLYGTQCDFHVAWMHRHRIRAAAVGPDDEVFMCLDNVPNVLVYSSTGTFLRQWSVTGRRILVSIVVVWGFQADAVFVVVLDIMTSKALVFQPDGTFLHYLGDSTTCCVEDLAVSGPDEVTVNDGLGHMQVFRVSDGTLSRTWRPTPAPSWTGRMVGLYGGPGQSGVALAEDRDIRLFDSDGTLLHTVACKSDQTCRRPVAFVQHCSVTMPNESILDVRRVADGVRLAKIWTPRHFDESVAIVLVSPQGTILIGDRTNFRVLRPKRLC